jgi:spore maturation protein CgeB
MNIKIAFFGSSLVSAYWNGAATYYRGIIKALYQSGHEITFYEPDAYDRQKNRDIEDPYYAKVVVYEATKDALLHVIKQASSADLLIKASGVGVFDEELEKGLLYLKYLDKQVAFWDVDAPATLDRIDNNPYDPFIQLIPQYDFIFTYGGGRKVIDAYMAHGAKNCFPIYNGIDPDTHATVALNPEFISDLAFLGNRLPDREARVDEFFFKPAAALPMSKFLLGGSGWQDKPMPTNVKYVGHVSTNEHNVLNSSSRIVLNISRDSMAKYGFSPATRVFEAAGAGACIITDEWEGIEHFFEIGTEILVARSGDDVIDLLQQLDEEEIIAIGQAAKKKALAKHTYAQRVKGLEHILFSKHIVASE